MDCVKSLTCSTDGKQHLHGIEKEEHDQEGNAGPQRQTQGLHGVEGLYVVLGLNLHSRIEEAIGAASCTVSGFLFHI